MRGQPSPSGAQTSSPAIEPLGRRVREATVGYVMVMLAISWVLDPIREFCVRADVNPLLATLWQALATLLLLTYAAGWLVRTFGVPPRLGLRLTVGVGAVVIFLACNALSALLLFGLSPLDLRARLLGAQGVVIVLVVAVAAVLPALRCRSGEA